MAAQKAQAVLLKKVKKQVAALKRKEEEARHNLRSALTKAKRNDLSEQAGVGKDREFLRRG